MNKFSICIAKQTPLVGQHCPKCWYSSLGAKKYNYKFESAIGHSPNPYKQVMGGDDAHFVTDNFMALVDQVGGWTEAQSEPNRFP